MEFWEAIDKVKHQWTWAEWLSVIDLSDGICHHPIQYRLAVNIARNPDGVLAKWVAEERVLDIPWLFEELKRSNYPNTDDPKVEHPIITYCEVCQTFCPAPPVNVKERREKQLAAILSYVIADD